MPATATPTQLREDAFSDGAMKIDEEQGVIYGVKILGRESRNGRVYSQTALEEAAKLYEGISVNLDHPDNPRSVRGIAEGWGVLRNTRVARDGVFGDLHYLKNHAQTPAIIERAQRFPRNFGLSHNASGTVVSTVDGPLIVESIEHVESVDLVSKPATTRGLFESQQENKTMPSKLSVRKVLERAKGREAKRLRRLLEMDEFAAMADAPVEVAAEPEPEEEMQASIESLILAVLRDDSLDAAGKLAKIRQILNVQDKLQEPAGAEAEPAGDGGGDTGGTMEESWQRRLAKLERRDMIRDVLESHGLTLSSIKRAQRKLLERCENEDEMEELVESFLELVPVGGPTGTRESRRTEKPAAKSIVESVGNADYEELKKEALAAR